MSIARFVELEAKEMQELFGDGGYRADGECQIVGLFSANRVEKAVTESCIKQNYSIQKLTYSEVMSIAEKNRA